MLMFICVVITVVSGVPTGPRHIKGVQIKNKGQERLWIEMTNEDSFILPPGQLASVILEDSWSGKIVAKSEECEFIKCNSPSTVAELTFGGDTKEDRYRVSVIEGYNKPIQIQPTGNSNFCKPSSCYANLNQDCPNSHQIKNENNNPVACKSIPEIFQKLCPQAVSSNTDNEMFACQTSNTYIVSIG